MMCSRSEAFNKALTIICTCICSAVEGNIKFWLRNNKSYIKISSLRTVSFCPSLTSRAYLNFWATWCAPCRREIPLLKAFQEQHGVDGIQVIGIAVEFPEPVIAYAKVAEFNYPILVGEQEAMAIAESSGIPFIGLPFTMIVTNDGELIGTRMGEIHQQHLDEIAVVLSQIDTGQIDKAAAREILSGF